MSLRTSTAPRRMGAMVPHAAKPLRVAFLVYPGIQALDLSGPLELFARATRLLRDERKSHPGYAPLVVGTEAGPIAGVSAAMDLALALIEEDLGADLALQVARAMVMYLRRPGDQSQYSAPLRLQAAQTPSIRALVAWAAEHPASDLSVPALARRIGKSPRQLTRVFQRELGVAPAGAIEQLRLEAARRALQQSGNGLEEIAAEAGFGSAAVLRRAFLRALHVTPSAYRARFTAQELAS